MSRQASQFSTALYPQSLLGNIKRKDGAERDITGQGDGEKGGVQPANGMDHPHRVQPL